MTFGRSYTEWQERKEAQRAANVAALCVPARVRGVYAPVGVSASVPKTNPLRSVAYRRLVAQMPCMLCGATPTQAAHPNAGKGMATKPDDRLCFPLCPRCHQRFDQGALFPKEIRRELEPAWGAQTRAVIVAEGLWPARLPAYEQPGGHAE